MPPQVDEVNRLVLQDGTADETTSLMALSPAVHSAERDSQKDLASLEVSYLERMRFWKQDTNSFSMAGSKNHRRSMRVNKALLALVSTITMTVLCILYKQGIFSQEGVKPSDMDYLACQTALSTLDPVHDLGVPGYHRPNTSVPSSILHRYREHHKKTRAIPTNAWYQNFLLLEPNDEPSILHRAYTIPYVVDAAGPIPGLRIHTNHIDSTTTVLQLNVNDLHGITMGVAHSTSGSSLVDWNKVYTVEEMTQLAITLSWDDFGMSTPIVKGMAYATMSYKSLSISDPISGQELSPAIATEVPLSGHVIVDKSSKMPCTTDDDESKSSAFVVQKELELYSPESDFTWLVFVSEPVKITCQTHGATTLIRVVGGSRLRNQDDPFFFRTALFKPCTKGMNPVYCHQEQMHPTALHIGQGDYGEVLREHAHLFPGSKAAVSYEFDRNEDVTELVFDWDVQSIGAPLYSTPKSNMSAVKEVITYALPHHMDMMQNQPPSDFLYFAPSLIGPALLVEGSSWSLVEKMPRISFRAERPPAQWSFRELSDSLSKDIDYRLPGFFQRGAGDTYFSGKMLARLGRILMISEELRELCKEPVEPYYSACKNVTLPTKRQMTDAIQALRSSVEVWINGTGETPFVYDHAWGGIASCGCDFNSKKAKCENQFPNCPAFGNPGLNFGNAFYNDMHFHYGYHIFGAAVAAHFDPHWGKQHFEQVLLLVRNIANPSEDDEYFPIMRHKDVYQGHSWASGIATSPLNGRNQESSSESLASYESIALYGSVMASIFAGKGESKEQLNKAVEVRRVGKLMTASELRATRRYYHINRKSNVKIYPEGYTPNVVGIMWQTMAQFQTWFGNSPYLPIGIQLLPLTPIAGHRDDVDWAKSMYPSFEAACDADEVCEEQGWSILKLGALATVGHGRLALSRARLLPDEVFESAGGNGHSLTNTLWFIATRAPVENPLPLDEASSTSVQPNKPFPEESVLTDCYMPETCTEYVLDTIVELYTCRQRIHWLINTMEMSQKDACVQVAAVEWPRECGKCNPLANYTETIKNAEAEAARRCPPCSQQQCHSDLNRCPVYERTYVCTGGPNEGGCSGFPWYLDSALCTECCDLTDCPKISPLEVPAVEATDESEPNCPTCTEEECLSAKGGLCPIQGAPFLCIAGASKGGCSPRPWQLQDGQCHKCCTVPQSCLE